MLRNHSLRLLNQLCHDHMQFRVHKRVELHTRVFSLAGPRMMACRSDSLDAGRWAAKSEDEMSIDWPELKLCDQQCGSMDAWEGVECPLILVGLVLFPARFSGAHWESVGHQRRGVMDL